MDLLFVGIINPRELLSYSVVIHRLAVKLREFKPNKIGIRLTIGLRLYLMDKELLFNVYLQISASEIVFIITDRSG